MSKDYLGRTFVARIIVRDGGEGDGLVIGFLMRGGEAVLKRGMVYDVVAHEGEAGAAIELVEAGPSCIPRTLADRASDQTSSVCWGTAVGHIVSGVRWNGACLTRAEYADYIKQMYGE